MRTAFGRRPWGRRPRLPAPAAFPRSAPPLTPAASLGIGCCISSECSPARSCHLAFHVGELRGSLFVTAAKKCGWPEHDDSSRRDQAVFRPLAVSGAGKGG